MTYQTLSGKDGAKTAVELDLIGKEVVFIELHECDGVRGWEEYRDVLTYNDLCDVESEGLKIRIPTPTIEDLRVGDIIRVTTYKENTILGRVHTDGELPWIRTTSETFKSIQLLSRETKGIQVKG